MQRIAVFASGRGSNFRSLFKASEAGLFPGTLVLLLSDKADAEALDFAREKGIETFLMDSSKPKGFLNHKEEEAYRDACMAAKVDWICLAGFMRILHGSLLEAFEGRILNIHPALLPSFPGLDSQKQAFEYGAKVAGCTVHFVNKGVDTGPIVMQKSVPIHDDDNAETLSAKILEHEHQIYPEALRRLFTESWSREGRRIVFASGKESP